MNLLKKIIKIIKNYVNQAQLISAIDIRDEVLICSTYEVINNTYKLLDVSIQENNGFKRLEIIDLEKALTTLEKLLDKAEHKINKRISKVIINAPYNQVNLINYPYIATIDGVINKNNIEDIKDIKKYESVINQDDFIINLKVNEFMLDDKIVQNPIGLYTKKISTNNIIVSVSKADIINMYQLMQYLSIDIVGIIHGLHALPYIMNKNSNKMKVIIDIDKEYTLLSITNGQKELHGEILNFGSKSILLQLATKIGMEEDYLDDFSISYKSLQSINNKMIHLKDKNVSHEEFIVELKNSINDYFTKIAKIISDKEYNNLDYIVIGDLADVISSNDLFTNSINNNIILVKGNKLDHVRSMALFEYYISNKDIDIGLSSLNERLNNLDY